MAVDYDLVILGGTEAARDAAIAASSWKARIALVEPFPASDRIWQSTEQYHQAFIQTVHQLHQARRTDRRGWLQAAVDQVPPTLRPHALNRDAITTWITSVIASFHQTRSPALLAAQGIDVVIGKAEFVRRPRLAVAVLHPLPDGEPRLLRSRSYLLATDARTVLPPIEGLTSVHPLLPEDLWRSLPELVIPSSLIILGGTPTALELAQAFCRLGTQVTLVVGNTRLLPQEDPEVGILIQAQLEAEGITVLSHTEVSQVRSLEGKKWIQAGSRAIAAEEILVATESSPHLAELNLEGVGVKWHDSGIPVNSKLQTTHPRIYAIPESRDQQQTKIAIETVLKNVLLFPRFRFQPQSGDIRGSSQVMGTDPGFIRQGLTEHEARQQYGDRITVVQEALQPTVEAQIWGETGWVKLIIHNRRVVGQWFIGSCFMEQTFETARRQIQTRLNQQKLQRNFLIRELQENWFDFWRDRTR